MSEADYYAPGSYRDPSAPWNEVDIPEKEFEVTCSQSLSRTASVWTDNYIPGASGVDYEPDGEGGCCASGWQDPDDTSDTDWAKEYSYEHFTPLQLIEMLKVKLESDLKNLENTPVDPKLPYKKQMEVRRLKHLINECDDWTEDETEYIVEN